MQRFAIGIEFCGTHYRGWQTQQTGVISVQETIEKVLSKIANEPISLHGAGRTDAGVHATNMVAHFDSSALRSERGWLMGSNSQLPKDPVDQSDESRLSCTLQSAGTSLSLCRL